MSWFGICVITTTFLCVYRLWVCYFLHLLLRNGSSFLVSFGFGVLRGDGIN
jgi:hypothetical protein